MDHFVPSIIIRKSIAVLVTRVAALQLLVVMTYLLIRLSKYWVFRQLFTDENFHDLNFWLGIAVFILVAVAQIIFLISLILLWFNEYYEIRKDVIIHTKGVLRKVEDIYSLKTIESGNVDRSLMGRLLGYGTVKIYSPVLKREYFLHDIANPSSVKDSVLAMLGGNRHDDRKIIPREI